MKHFLNLAALTLSTGLVLMAGASHAQTSLVGGFTGASSTLTTTGNSTDTFNGATLAASSSVTFGQAVQATYAGTSGMFATTGNYNVNYAGTMHSNVYIDLISSGSVTYTFGSTTLPSAITFSIDQTGTSTLENFTFTANKLVWYGQGTNDVYLGAVGSLNGTGAEALGLPVGSPYDNSEIDFHFHGGSPVALTISTPEPGVVALVIGFSAPLAGFGLRRRSNK